MARSVAFFFLLISLTVAHCVTWRYSKDDFSQALKSEDSSKLSQCLDEVKREAETAIGLSAHLGTVMHPAIEATKSLANQEITREEALRVVERQFEKNNGSVLLQGMIGNITAGNEWTVERNAITHSFASSKNGVKWWDLAVKEWENGQKSIKKLYEVWQNAISVLKSPNTNRYDHMKIAHEFEQTALEFNTGTFLKGITAELDFFYTAWKKDHATEKFTAVRRFW